MITLNNNIQNNKLAFEARKPGHAPKKVRGAIKYFTEKSNKNLKGINFADTFIMQGETTTKNGTKATLYIIDQKPYVSPPECREEVLQKFYETVAGFASKGKYNK